MTYLLNGKFDMFKSGAAFWEWLTSASAKTYVIILCVTIALLIAAVVFACCKRARVRKNDVNVLLLLGDDDKSVDAEIFKRNYAMVLISKNDNTMTAKDRQIEQPVLLTDNSDELAAENEEIVSDIVAPDDEEFIVEDTVTDTEVEDVIEEEPEEDKEAEEEVIEEIEEAEPVTDVLAVVDTEEEIPFNEQVDDAEEEEIEELVEEEELESLDEAEEELDDIAEETVEEVAEEEIEEIIDEEVIDEPVEMEIEEIKEPIEEVAEIDNEEVVEENDSAINNDNIIIAPIIIDTPQDNVEVEVFESEVEDEIEEEVKPEVVIYDIDASEDYARDRIEVVNYIRVAGKVKSETSLIDNEEVAEEEVAEEVAEEPIEVSEEIFMIETESEPEEESEVTEEVAEEVIEPEVVEETVEELAEPEVIEVEETPVAEELTEEPIEEIIEEAASDIVDDTQESVIVIDESEEDKETAAYTIVKEEEAVPEAIEAVQNGEVIVDANGDGIVAEVLVDKNILKARYKTVDLETRLRRADESTKIFYSELKNFLLSYDGVKSRVSKKFDTFTIGRFIVAKMAVRGNVINLYLALASESIDNKYFAEDVGDSDTYGKTPTLHKVKSKRGCKYGIELIRDIMSELQIQTNEAYEPTDFVAAYPPENIEEKKDAIRYLFKESVSVEEIGELSDEEALELIEVVKNKQYTINKFMPINKYVVFVDDLDALYSAGETVTIGDLIEKEALPKEENIFLEIRAKGRINKPLTVEAHSFDPAAIKMIILTDGKVIQYK